MLNVPGRVRTQVRTGTNSLGTNENRNLRYRLLIDWFVGSLHVMTSTLLLLWHLLRSIIPHKDESEHNKENVKEIANRIAKIRQDGETNIKNCSQHFWSRRYPSKPTRSHRIDMSSFSRIRTMHSGSRWRRVVDFRTHRTPQLVLVCFYQFFVT